MRYEKTKTKRFLDKWKYSLTTTHNVVITKGADGKVSESWRSKSVQERINQMEFFLKHHSTGEWLRVGNVIYLMTLGDAFNMRMHFDEDIEVMKVAVD